MNTIQNYRKKESNPGLFSIIIFYLVQNRCLGARCPSCTPLSKFLSLFAALLLASAVAVLIIVLMKQPSTSITSMIKIDFDH
jgi:hypothetical protein